MKEHIYLINFLIICLTLFFFSCENSIEKVKTLTAINNVPDETMMNFEVVQTEYARMVYKLTSPRLERFLQVKEPYELFPKGLHLQMYDSLQHLTSDVKCNYAIRKTRDKIMEGKYNVEITNIKGEKLNTEHIIWDENKDKMWSDDKVKITTPTEILFGNGFESNSDFSKYKIRHLTGTIYR